MNEISSESLDRPDEPIQYDTDNDTAEQFGQKWPNRRDLVHFESTFETTCGKRVERAEQIKTFAGFRMSPGGQWIFLDQACMCARLSEPASMCVGVSLKCDNYVCGCLACVWPAKPISDMFLVNQTIEIEVWTMVAIVVWIFDDDDDNDEINDVNRGDS